MTKKTPARLAYSIPTAMRVASLGKMALYEAINRGDLIAKKCGNRTLILREDLATFLGALPNYVPKAIKKTAMTSTSEASTTSP